MNQKRSLGQILKEFESLCEELDAGVEPLEITDMLPELRGELKAKVDDWLSYLDGVETAIEHAKKHKEQWSKRLSVLQNIEKRLKDYLLYVMRVDGWHELRGEQGRISLRRNSNPSLKLALPVTKFSSNYVLSHALSNADIITDFPEFLTVTKLVIVDNESIKRALLAGRSIEFASLEFGEHIRTSL